MVEYTATVTASQRGMAFPFQEERLVIAPQQLVYRQNLSAASGEIPKSVGTGSVSQASGLVTNIDPMSGEKIGSVLSEARRPSRLLLR